MGLLALLLLAAVGLFDLFGDVGLDLVLQTLFLVVAFVFVLDVLVKAAFRPVAFLALRDWTLELAQNLVRFSSGSLSLVEVVAGECD